MLSFAMISVMQACDDGASPDDPIRISITQPEDGAVLRDSVVRILTEVESHCGCWAHVEFRIDGVHEYSSFIPQYYYDWIPGDRYGEHTIEARLIVQQRGEVSDSVRITILHPDSIQTHLAIEQH